MTTSAYVVLLPVKPPARGKSRLDGRPRRAVARWPPPSPSTPRAPASRPRSVRRRAGRHRRRRASPTELRSAGCETIPDGVHRRPQRVAAPGRRRGRAAAGRTAYRWLSAPTCRRCCPTTSTPRWRVRRRVAASFVADRDGRRHDALHRGVRRASTRASGIGSRQAHLGSGAREISASPCLTCGSDVDDPAPSPRPWRWGRRRTPGWRLPRLTRPADAPKGAASRWPPSRRASGLLGGLLRRSLLGRGLLRRRLLGRRLLGGAFLATVFLAGAFFAAGAFLAGPSSRAPSWPAPSWPAPSSPARPSSPAPWWRSPSWRARPSWPARLLRRRGRLLRGRRPARPSVSFGSFLAPDTTFFRSAPAVNFGTAVFLALIRAPVCGLRTQRASRTRFSNEPKPVMATFSPFATSRVIVSRTDSSACWACLRFPS